MGVLGVNGLRGRRRFCGDLRGVLALRAERDTRVESLRGEDHSGPQKRPRRGTPRARQDEPISRVVQRLGPTYGRGTSPRDGHDSPQVQVRKVGSLDLLRHRAHVESSPSCLYEARPGGYDRSALEASHGRILSPAPCGQTSDEVPCRST